MVESPRWHDGRLWFPHWGTPEIVAVDLLGNAEVMAEGPSGLGQSIGWLPDGRMLETGEELTRYEPDGTTTTHADLTHISREFWSEMTIDGRGNIYINTIGFDFFEEMIDRVSDRSKPPTGLIALITPDGLARKVADGIAFPNGMVITPDNETLIVSESFTGSLLAFDIAEDGGLSGRRTWAEDLGPDGICLDAEGAVWTSSPANECVRVAEGGRILDRIPLDRNCFATMLGGEDGRTLFMMANRFLGPDKFDQMLAERTGQVLIADVPVPGAGWP